MLAGSIVYTISFLLLLSGIFMFPRKEEEIPFFTWVPLNVVLALLCQGLIGEAFAIFSLKISLWAVAGFNSLFAIGLWFLVYMAGFQKYGMDIAEGIIGTVLLIITICISSIRFTPDLLPNFISIEGASAFGQANKYMYEGLSENPMILPGFSKSLWMEVFNPVMGAFNVYKVYLICESALFFLAGAVFVSLISRKLKNIPLKIIGGVFSLIYFLGYPLYYFEFGLSNVLFGFVLVSFLFYFTIALVYDEIDEIFCIIAINLGLNGIFLTCTKFAPMVFLSIAFSVLAKAYSDFNINSVQTRLRLVKIFFAPLLLGIIYNMLKHTKVKQEAIGVYSDTYSNFVLFLPFVIVGVYYVLKEYKMDAPVLYFSLFSLILCVVTFVLSIKDILSEGIFGISTGLMWIFAIVVLMEAMEYFVYETPICAAAGSLLFIVLLVLNYSNADSVVVKKNNSFIVSGAQNFLNIHATAKDYLHSGGILPNEVELFEFISNNTNYLSEECIIIGDEYFTNWAYRFTNQNLVYNKKSIEDLDKMISGDTRFLLYKNSNGYKNIKSKINNMGRLVKENSAGGVVEIRHGK